MFKRPSASRRDAPHERARARDEHHSPAMSTAHTPHARDGRAIAHGASFLSRVVVVVVSLSVVCLGLLKKGQTATDTVVGNKHTRYSAFVFMFRP